MKRLVFLSGDFSSGSTLLWLLFRKTGAFHTLYEPLHERLPEFLIYPLRSYERHFFSSDYFAEFKGFSEVANLHRRSWGTCDFYREADDDDPDLYRYLSYLIGMSFTRCDRVALQFNRVAFKLGWLRRNFPGVPVIHIHRDPQKRWDSIVRRAQAHHGREDVGQHSVEFGGMGIANWCDRLQDQFPELNAQCSRNGYDRFLKLHNLSLEQHRLHADVSIKYEELVSNFSVVCPQAFNAVGYRADVHHLSQFVIPPSRHRTLTNRHNSIGRGILRYCDKAGSLYARAILRLRRRRQQ